MGTIVKKLALCADDLILLLNDPGSLLREVSQILIIQSCRVVDKLEQIPDSTYRHESLSSSRPISAPCMDRFSAISGY